MDNWLIGDVVITPSGEYATVQDQANEFYPNVLSVELWNGGGGRCFHTDDLRFYNSDAGIVALNPLREELAEARAYKERYEKNTHYNLLILTGECAVELEKLGMTDTQAFFSRVNDKISESINGALKEGMKK